MATDFATSNLTAGPHYVGAPKFRKPSTQVSEARSQGTPSALAFSLAERIQIPALMALIAELETGANVTTARRMKLGPHDTGAKENLHVERPLS